MEKYSFAINQGNVFLDFLGNFIVFNSTVRITGNTERIVLPVVSCGMVKQIALFDFFLKTLLHTLRFQTRYFLSIIIKRTREALNRIKILNKDTVESELGNPIDSANTHIVIHRAAEVNTSVAISGRVGDRHGKVLSDKFSFGNYFARFFGRREAAAEHIKEAVDSE